MVESARAPSNMDIDEEEAEVEHMLSPSKSKRRRQSSSTADASSADVLKVRPSPAKKSKPEPGAAPSPAPVISAEDSKRKPGESVQAFSARLMALRRAAREAVEGARPPVSPDASALLSTDPTLDEDDDDEGLADMATLMDASLAARKAKEKVDAAAQSTQSSSRSPSPAQKRRSNRSGKRTDIYSNSTAPPTRRTTAAVEQGSSKRKRRGSSSDEPVVKSMLDDWAEGKNIGGSGAFSLANLTKEHRLRQKNGWISHAQATALLESRVWHSLVTRSSMLSLLAGRPG